MRAAMAFSLLDALIARTIKRGSLTLIGADGDRRTHGDGAPPMVAMRISDPSYYAKILVNPELTVGEAYMDGVLTFDEGSLAEFLALFHRNARNLRSAPGRVQIGAVIRKLRRFQQFNPIGKAQENVAHHYDISNDFYRLFLDEDLQYSCAYFEHDGQSLEDAQRAKLRHIAAKLRIEPGMRVLDIGCGWGGMAIYLAETLGAHVTGVTLSREQRDLAAARAQERGLDGRIDFRLMDYRETNETFDRIVSVGMFEHVGAPHYREFFTKICGLLRDDGLALIHTIGSKGPPGVTGPWIRKYIFPGGYSPALSEFMAAIETTGLWVSDVEVLRLHYADTLREWGRRFASNREKARAMFDERFCRMWEFYLTTAEFSFREGGQLNFQVQIAKSHRSAPIRRDYMAAAEEALRVKP
jgi:cyclopropane-fatty-acyl-phospholipid synthase